MLGALKIYKVYFTYAKYFMTFFARFMDIVFGEKVKEKTTGVTRHEPVFTLVIADHIF